MIGPQLESGRPAASEIPQHDGSADVSGREGAPIGTDRGAGDDMDEPAERPDQAVAAKVPQLDRTVLGGGRERASVGTERDAADRAGMTGERRPDPGRNRAWKRTTTISQRRA